MVFFFVSARSFDEHPTRGGLWLINTSGKVGTANRGIALPAVRMVSSKTSRPKRPRPGEAYGEWQATD